MFSGILLITAIYRKDGSYVGGHQIEIGPAGTLKAALVALNAVQQDAGLVHILQGCGGKGHGVVQTHLPAGKFVVRGVNIFADNFGCLLLRRLMREMGCAKKVIVGGWSSAPYGTRIESIGKFQFPHVSAKYRAITLRGAALPMKDTDDFLEATVPHRWKDTDRGSTWNR